MVDSVRSPVRLAIRNEGEFVNAYIALTTSMADAMLIGSVLRGALDATPGAFDRWKQLMSDILASGITKALGAPPLDMIEETPPEHERSGRA